MYTTIRTIYSSSDSLVLHNRDSGNENIEYQGAALEIFDFFVDVVLQCSLENSNFKRAFLNGPPNKGVLNGSSESTSTGRLIN